MAEYIISITARDRSGIVAGVSKALVNMHGNIRAASQTVHQGYFAMILLCDIADELSTDEISKRICKEFSFDIHVYVTEYEKEAAKTESEGENYIVSILGPDKPGILSEVTNLMAQRQINIEDLYCYTNSKGEFVVILQVTISDQRAFGVLQAQLDDLGGRLNQSINIQHEDIFIATNELSLRKKK